MEWNRMEEKIGNITSSKEKRRTYEKALWAHRRLGHAHESARYRTESWPNKWTRPIDDGTLRVTCDPWCHALQP